MSKTSSSFRRNNVFPFGVHLPVGGAEEINVPVLLVRNRTRIVLSVVPKSSSRARFDSTADFVFGGISVMIAEQSLAGHRKLFGDEPLKS